MKQEINEGKKLLSSIRKLTTNRVISKFLQHFKSAAEKKENKIENPGLAKIREARTAYLNACQKRADLENELGKKDAEIIESSAVSRNIESAIESLKDAHSNTLEILSGINVASGELDAAIQIARGGTGISHSRATSILEKCLEASNLTLNGLGAQKDLLLQAISAAKQKELRLDIKISAKSSGHAALLTTEKAKKSHKNAILQIGSDVFTPQDVVGLELQLNHYLGCPASLRSVDRVDLETLKKLNGIVRQELFVFTLNKEIVGFSGLEISFFEGPSEVVWLNWTGIAQPFQGNGIGKSMMEYIGARAKEAGYSHLGVKTCHVYGPAIALYEKNGFKYTGKMEHYFGKDEPLLVYMKDLQQ